MTQSKEVKCTVLCNIIQRFKSLTSEQLEKFNKLYILRRDDKSFDERSVLLWQLIEDDVDCLFYVYEAYQNYIAELPNFFTECYLWGYDVNDIVLELIHLQETIDNPTQPAKDKDDNFYAKCSICGKVDIVENFAIYGVEHCNRGKCTDCVRQQVIKAKSF